MKSSFLLLASFCIFFSCRKDEAPCANKEIFYTGNHLVDVSVIGSDKTINDSLAYYHLQVVSINPVVNGIEIEARPIYKNNVIFNNAYYITRTTLNGQTNYSSTSWLDPAPIEVDLKPEITSAVARNIATNNLPELGCYSFQVGLFDNWDYDSRMSSPFILVYYFKSIKSEAYIVIDAKNGQVIVKWDGKTPLVICSGELLHCY